MSSNTCPCQRKNATAANPYIIRILNALKESLKTEARSPRETGKQVLEAALTLQKVYRMQRRRAMPRSVILKVRIQMMKGSSRRYALQLHVKARNP